MRSVIIWTTTYVNIAQRRGREMHMAQLGGNLQPLFLGQDERRRILVRSPRR